MSPPGSKRSAKTGLPPGTPVHIGDRMTEEMALSVFTYDEQSLDERTSATLEDCVPRAPRGGTTWVIVQGVHQVDELQRLARTFKLHPLVLEDIVNTEQRPKIEDYGEYLFIVLRSLSLTPGGHASLTNEQVSLVLGPNFVLSFQEGATDAFAQVRARLRSGKGLLRSSGSDYLAYTLIDAVVDHYFPVLEGLGEEIEHLEERILKKAEPETIPRLHKLRSATIALRRCIWPMREVVGHLERGESALIKKDTVMYLRDVYDHTIQVIETIETFRDILTGMADIHLSSVSNQTNERMKVLTIFATFFLPLTFITGIYGMNFQIMPELAWPWGYPAVLALMGLLVGGMVWFFKHKGWL